MTAAVGVDPLTSAWPRDRADVVDPVLWRYAQQVMATHAPDPDTGRCRFCGDQSPCRAARSAERAARAALAGRQRGHTARVDARSVGTVYCPAGRRSSPTPWGSYTEPGRVQAEQTVGAGITQEDHR